MRDLSKTKIIESWQAGRIPVIERRVGVKGADYICWMLNISTSFQNMPGLVSTKWVPRDLRDLRMSELRKAVLTIVDYNERGYLTCESTETLLDFIYSELNRRLNK